MGRADTDIGIPEFYENLVDQQCAKPQTLGILGSDHFLRAHQLVELLFCQEFQRHGGLLEGGALLVRLLGNLGSC